jgi:hypothetical protein
MLDDLELQQVQRIDVEEDQVLVQHQVPALEGDFLQRLDRRATRIALRGILTGAEARDGLEKLRAKFHAAAPVLFVADITTATKVDQVLIEELGVREVAGNPERFEYAFTLREFLLPPAPTTETALVDEEVRAEGQEQADEQVEQIAQNAGDLRVQIELDSDNQDYTNVLVLVEGTTEAGERITFTIEEQIDGLYRRENVPAGEYVISAMRR